MSEHSRMLRTLLGAAICVNILLFILWICTLFWFDVGDGMFYTLTALVVVGMIAGHVLRIAFIKSLRRDRSAVIDTSNDADL